VIAHLFPFFDGLDALLATVLPPLVRLIIYGAVSGAVTMLVYGLVSNQEAIRRQKVRIQAIRDELKVAQDDFARTMQLSRQNLGAALRLLGLSAWPAVVASLPVLVMILWLSMRWSQPMPEAGTVVPISHTPSTATLAVEPPNVLTDNAVRWPPVDAPATLQGDEGALYAGLGAKPPASTLHKRTWWNALLDNPAGYLPDDANVEEINFALPQREVLHFGPGWIRGFELTYFATVILVSLLLKSVFRIA
jgi:hypothetical protein